ncbi:MAG: hypothetical protein SFV15_09810 [Polyangiaceae bacterium]|nr:hypothetical protein [Polyangiaceae bacterium]
MSLERPKLTPAPLGPVLVKRSGQVSWVSVAVLGVAAATQLTQCGGEDESSTPAPNTGGSMLQPPMAAPSGGARNGSGGVQGTGGVPIIAPMVPPMPAPMIAPPMDAPVGGSPAAFGGSAAQAGAAGVLAGGQAAAAGGSGGAPEGEAGGAIAPMPPPMPPPMPAPLVPSTR